MINELKKKKVFTKLPLTVLRHKNKNNNRNHINKPPSTSNKNSIDKINSILINNLYYNLITRNQNPSKPLPSKPHIKTTVIPITKYPITIQTQSPSMRPPPRFTPFKEYSYQEDKNKRDYMKNFHLITPKLNRDPAQALFAIFDGHGGRTPAVFCKDNFDLVFEKYMRETKGNVEKSIKLTFEQIDSDLLAKLKEDERMGSTVTMIYISINSMNKRRIYATNVGDSKGYLLQKSGKCIKLTREHTCKEPDEVERIKQKGGYVFNERVFSSLMVTRSIGDKELKKYGVIAEPYISQLNIDNSNDNYIIIASDGIWDIIDEEKLSIFAKEDMPAEALCKRLVKMSIEGGSNDNISCIVIKL